VFLILDKDFCLLVKSMLLYLHFYEIIVIYFNFRIADLPADKKAKMEDPGSFYS
jgi:hypothetical protein